MFEVDSISEIYRKLGNQTKSENVIIVSVFQQEGLKYANSINGVFSLRLNNTHEHYGNPFSNVKKEILKGLIPTKTTRESVERYIEWLLSKETNINTKQHKFILDNIKSGVLKNRPIIYYKELGEPSHATALDYIINKYIL